jgi:hypothetical protein
MNQQKLLHNSTPQELIFKKKLQTFLKFIIINKNMKKGTISKHEKVIFRKY